jgi:hypothetical protein
MEKNPDLGFGMEKKFGSGMENIRIRDKHPGSATLVRLKNILLSARLRFSLKKGSAAIVSLSSHITLP